MMGVQGYFFFFDVVISPFFKEDILKNRAVSPSHSHSVLVYSWE